MKKLLAILLALSLCMAFAACSSEEETASSEVTESESESAAEEEETVEEETVENPMVEYESLDEINGLVGVSIPAMEGASEETFYVINDTIAQYNFTRDGIAYELRGAVGQDEDISGLYDGGEDTIFVDSIDVEFAAYYTDEFHAARILAMGAQYVLYTNDAGTLSDEDFDTVSYELYDALPYEETEEEVTDVGVANPMVEYTSLEEINEIAGVTLVPVEGADESMNCYYVINDEVAEYDFTLDGYDYTLRGALGQDVDISGIYSGDGLIFDRTLDSDYSVYTDETYKACRMLVGDAQYVLTVMDYGEISSEDFELTCQAVLAAITDAQ